PSLTMMTSASPAASLAMARAGNGVSPATASAAALFIRSRRETDIRRPHCPGRPQRDRPFRLTHSSFCILIAFRGLVNVPARSTASAPARFNRGTDMFALRSAVVAAILSIVSIAAHAEETVHKLAIHVDENDPAVMNLALNNAQNVKQYYEAKGEK